MAISLIVFSIVLTIAWIIQPFAIIGIKPIIREILAELRAQRRRPAGAAILKVYHRAHRGLDRFEFA
jgi:hypothetical protein